MKNSCNAFNAKHPISNPMSFWTEQDVLQYIDEKHLKICSVYGDIIADQNSCLKCTGCNRTGCVLCGFGAHMPHSRRFIELKESHPELYGLIDVASNNGYTMRKAIEWINEHSDKKIMI